MENNVNVKYKVTVWGITYYPWEQKVEGKELTELLKAPFVTKLTKKDTGEEKNNSNEADTWADTNDNVWEDNSQAENTSNSNNADNADLEQVDFTEEELRVLPEEELREIYAEVQKSLGKTAPKNIKVETIIANLLK